MPQDVARLAKSAGLDPDAVLLELIERGIEIDDVRTPIDGAMWKAARAVVRELLGGPRIVKPAADTRTDVLALAPRSSALTGMLTVEEVNSIHARLCDDFAKTSDPIDPPGCRSMALLESAVSRQHSGYGDLLKYHEPVLNAASLLYGICNDHPFHNGNKRTALVAALAHLDRNRLVLRAAQRDVLRLMINVADHSIVQRPLRIGRETTPVPRRGTPDEEVTAIAEWFRPRLEKLTRGEAQITYRELRQILANFGLTVGQARNKAAITRTERRFLRGSRQQTLMALDWPGDGRQVSISTVKHVRQTLRLCEEDGVTSEAFYGRGVRIDRYINDYRLVLRKLASR